MTRIRAPDKDDWGKLKRGLKNLNEINLYETQVNAAALNHLLKLPKIQRIYVWETKLPLSYLDSIAKINPTISLIYER